VSRAQRYHLRISFLVLDFFLTGASLLPAVFAILIFFGYSAWKASKYKLPNLDTLTHKQRKNLRDEYESLAKRGGPENNEVTAGDISACCDDIGVDMSIDEIEAIILEGDKNHSGALGFDQFLDILHAGSGKFPELITAFDRRRHMQGVYAIVGVIVFMLYPGVCQTAFAALRCRDLGDGVSVLEADYAIECESSKYQLFRVFAMFTILAVPVGIPVGAFLLMRKSEEKILAEDLDTLRQFNVLVGDYEPQYHYWECIELGRKLILAGFVSILRLLVSRLRACCTFSVSHVAMNRVPLSCRSCSWRPEARYRSQLRWSYLSVSSRCRCGARLTPTRPTTSSKRCPRSPSSSYFLA
jgi:ABC-type sugar transport system permease subunit